MYIVIFFDEAPRKVGGLVSRYDGMVGVQLWFWVSPACLANADAIPLALPLDAPWIVQSSALLGSKRKSLSLATVQQLRSS